jgi:hypothetical protein
VIPTNCPRMTSESREGTKCAREAFRLVWSVDPCINRMFGLSTCGGR